jgi:hypothetical protein
MCEVLSNLNFGFRNKEDIAVRNVFVSVATVFCLGALVLLPAIAQSTSQDMPMRGMMGGHARMGAMAGGRLAYLKSDLKITNAQQAAWKEYADAVTDRVGVMQSVRQTMMEAMRTGDTNERMDARITGMESMVAAMKAVKPATEKLYAVLSDEQKKGPDQLIGMSCGAM